MELEYVTQMSKMDTQTLNEMMNQYGNDIWNYAYFLTKQHALADDIAQEVFIKAYYGIHTFRGQSALKTWLLTITRHTAFRHKQAFFLRKVTLQDKPRLDAQSRSAEAEYMESQYTDEIWRMIMSLPRKFREVLVLDLYYEMPITQIAELLNVATGTVKSRLYRARKKVQNMLKENSGYE
ncbi:RNA polymerase, sigma-24 subunit, ECF subfamily protein [Paenibacillus vortex V453]|uniref:RNA polymerase sigma factor n=1 Tax=Paenibacillus vortex V453 TaxID=715225 RepID=A0A2R9SW38_9BACL|nr:MULTISPECIES: RNA polymerase sigma factor [Paenibacillus]EFU41551.1 RNA polymerase, sigma-24 subunit, ECF subfamily protein [Paenibacillus vortex V453]MPY16411.1 RNA polymerase sigma factor [Paenibacillus glucanolyticus]